MLSYFEDEVLGADLASFQIPDRILTVLQVTEVVEAAQRQ